MFDYEQYKKDNAALFKSIYEAAIKEDKVTLDKLAKDIDFNIDVKDEDGWLTPGGKLGSEDKRDAAIFLINYGANINQIAKGAAFGGNRTFAEMLREYYGASIHSIARGAARKGDLLYTRFLYSLYIKTYRNCNDNADPCDPVKLRSQIVKNAVIGGNVEICNTFYDFLSSKLEDKVFVGIARRGYPKSEELQDYLYHIRANNIIKYLNDKIKEKLSLILPSFARNGHRELVEQVRLNQFVSIHYIAQAAARGGRIDYAEFLRDQGAYPTEIAIGAARGGYRKYAEFLRLNYGADGLSIVKSAARRGDIKYCSILCSSLFFVNNAFIWYFHKYFARHVASKLMMLHIFNFFPEKKFSKHIVKVLSTCYTNHPTYKKTLKEFNFSGIPMHKHFTFNQHLAKSNLRLLFWFMYCPQLVTDGKLSRELFMYISIFISPMTFSETVDLYERKSFLIYRELLTNDLGELPKSETKFSTLNATKNTKSYKELITLLSLERNKIFRSEDKRQKAILDHHHDRLVKRSFF